jgi:glutathione S-transferase
MKLRAIMRYRHLPFDWVHRQAEDRQALSARLKVVLMPVLHIPWEDVYLVDSTPIAYDLERRHQERSVLPTDTAMAFLVHLLEDMADEWLTKAMFLYRWEKPEDQAYSARWIIADSRPDLDGTAFDNAVDAIRARQVSRMALVGCTPENAPVIKASYLDALDALNSHVRINRFLFGSRPSLADFAWFGQLKTLATDTSPMLQMRADAPMVEHWVRQVDDLSGTNGDWIDNPASLPAATRQLLTLAGQDYLPFLQANAKAIDAGQNEMTVNLRDQVYRQAPFGYQKKCLMWLQQELAAMPGADRDRVRPILEETGCWPVLVAGQDKITP